MNCTRSIRRMGWIESGWLEEYDETIPFFKSLWWKISSRAMNWINSVPPITVTTFVFSSGLYPFELETKLNVFLTYSISYCIHIIYNVGIRTRDFSLQGESFQSTVPTSSMERSPNPVAVTAFAETILLFKIWKTKLFAVLCVCKIEKMHCGSLTVYYRDYPRIILSYISAGCPLSDVQTFC